jgi:hypothetical protein
MQSLTALESGKAAATTSIDEAKASTLSSCFVYRSNKKRTGAQAFGAVRLFYSG